MFGKTAYLKLVLSITLELDITLKCPLKKNKIMDLHACVALRYLTTVVYFKRHIIYSITVCPF